MTKIARPGLQMRGPALPNGYDGIINGNITNGSWNLLEPTVNAYARTVIPNGAKVITDYNTIHPKTPRMTILRMNANIRVPAYLYSITAKVPVSSSGTAGPPQSGFDAGWWMQPMQHRHDLLMSVIGPEIDVAPEIVRVTVCGPDEIYDEVFVRFGQNAAGLAAAGLTQANDEASFFVYIDNVIRHVKNTSIMLDIGSYNGSTAFTKTVIDHLVAHAPVKPTLAQASLNAKDANNSAIYTLMAEYGKHGNNTCILRMQMEPGVMGADFVTCARAAISYGVSELEVSSDYVNQPLTELEQFNIGLHNNA